MTKPTITADEARKNSKLNEIDEDYILCDIYKSIENMSKTGGKVIGRSYQKCTLESVDFNSILEKLRDKGFAVEFGDTPNKIQITVSW